MSLTITRQPYALQAAGMPIQYGLQSNYHVVTAGVKAVYKITALASPTAGDNFTLTWGNKSVTFTFAASPDDSGTELPVTNVAATLAPIMAQHYELGADYLVFSAVAGEITLSAREEGTDYNLSKSGAYSLTLTQTTAGVDSELRSNFRVALDVYMEDLVGGTLFSKVASLEATVDDNGDTAFDLSAILWNELRWYRPVFNSNQPMACPELARTYYIRYAESSGIPAVRRKATATSPYAKYALRAKVDQSRAAQFSRYVDHFSASPGTGLTSMVANGLTFAPVRKEVTTEQPEYLFYIVNDATIYYMALLVTWSNGAATYHMPYYGTGTYKHHVICFPVGHDALNIASLAPAPGVTAVSYKIRLYTDSSPSVDYTEREFVITSGCPYPNRYFLFLNSLGAFETMRTTAYFAKGLTVSQDEYQRPFIQNAGEPVAEYFNGDGAFTEGRKGGTGIMLSEWIEHYAKEFMSAEVRYELDMTGLRYLPIVLLTREAEYYRDRQKVPFAFRFEYKYGYDSGVKSAISAWTGDYGGEPYAARVSPDWAFYGQEATITAEEMADKYVENALAYPDGITAIGSDYPAYDLPTT